MRLRDAIEMLADSGVEALGPTTWADLGCGDGTFTLALAALLAAGSTIHAMDRDRLALRKIPSAHNGVRIVTHRGDFANETWPFADLDGILMANSLHYVDDQAAFIRACGPLMTPWRRFLIVEYDTNEASRWVPYPVSQTKLTTLFAPAGYSSITMLRSRPSVYRRASLYAALIAPSRSSATNGDAPRRSHAQKAKHPAISKNAAVMNASRFVLTIPEARTKTRACQADRRTLTKSGHRSARR